jgi:hypothetical protein
MQTEIVNHLKEKFSPDAIILHGSRARGKERPHSDWDFILLFSGETELKTGRTLFKDQNIEYTVTMLPVKNVYEEFGAKLQQAKVLYESNGSGTELLKRAEEYYSEGVHWSLEKIAGHKLWMQGRIDGMRDNTDNLIIFDKYDRDVRGRLFNYWYWILQQKHSQPVYVALEEIKEADPDYFKLVEAYFVEIDLKKKVELAEAISVKLF